MRSLPVYTAAERFYVVGVEYQARGFPVQGQQTLIGRLQEHVSEILPQRQRRRVDEKSLTQYNLGSSEIIRQHEVGSQFVGKRRHGFDHLVDDRGRKGPREVTRGVGREWWALCQVEGLTTQGHTFCFRNLRRLVTKFLELSPVGSEVSELIARSSQRRRQVSFADGPSSVDHVVAHGRLLDIGTGVREWPDSCLNLFERERTFSVHREVGHDGPYWITRGGINRRDCERTEDVDAQRRLFPDDLLCCLHYGWWS